MTIGLLHLGRTAAGPLFTLELAAAMSSLTAVCVVTSSDADLADSFRRLAAPSLAVPTFTSTRAAAFGLVRVPKLARTILDFLQSHDVTTLVVTMEQIWQPFIANYLRRHGIRILLIVHDASPHPGEDGWLTRTLRHWERRQAAGAIVLSRTVKSALVEQGAFKQDAIWTSTHPSFRPPRLPQPREIMGGGPVTVGFFGRMSRYKGLDLGLAAVNELRSRGRRIHLRIVGRGIPSDTPGLSHDDNVIDDRFVPDREIQDVLEQFDIALLPYIEASQSGVLAYTTALGIPSVATPVGGLADQALEAGSTVISAAVSARALADSVERLLDDPELYKRLSRTGIERSATVLTWERLSVDILRAVSASEV